MRDINLLKALSLADDELVEDAIGQKEASAPKKNKKREQKPRRNLLLIAAMLILAVAVVLPVVFLGRTAGPVENTTTSGINDGTSGGAPVSLKGYDPERVADYLDSPYYEVIKQHDYYKYLQEEAIKNPIRPKPQSTMADMTGFPVGTNEMPEGTMAPVGPGDLPGDGNSGGVFDDVTDNQVDGVVEADLFKRTATHIFYLAVHNESIAVNAYTIAGEDSALCGSFPLPLPFASSQGIYLSGDGTTLCYLGSANGMTHLILLDISDPCNMKQITHLKADGYIKDSRFVKDDLYLFLSYMPSNVVYNLPSSFVPSIKEEGKAKTLFTPDEILLPENPAGMYYTLALKIDLFSATVVDKKAYMNAFDDLYMSNSHIYLANRRLSKTLEGNIYTFETFTDVLCLAYGEEGIQYKGKLTVKGYLNDQYSMDEYEGIFRMVTTLDVTRGEALVTTAPVTSRVPVDTDLVPDGTTASEIPDSTWILETTWGLEPEATTLPYVEAHPVSPYHAANVYEEGTLATTTTEAPVSAPRPILGEDVSASLYCISLEDFSVVATVEHFAPQGEKVFSVRFDGDTAYVCTAKKSWNQILDPVFLFDLSDIGQITYKESGEIDGFSSSLITFGNGTLLGIGRGSQDMTFKLEAFRETKNSVESIGLLTENGVFPQTYKAYFLNREQQLVGMGCYPYGGEYAFTPRYVVWQFDESRPNLEERFVEVVNLPMKNAVWEDYRAALIDGYFYIFSSDDFHVVPLA